MAALGLSCSLWDLAPRPGIEPGPPALGAQGLSHWTTRELPLTFFKIKNTNGWQIALKNLSIETLIPFESICPLCILGEEWAKMEILPTSLWLLDLCIALHIERNEMKGLDSVLTNAYVPDYWQVLVTCHYIVIKYASPGITVILCFFFVPLFFFFFFF